MISIYAHTDLNGRDDRCSSNSLVENDGWESKEYFFLKEREEEGKRRKKSWKGAAAKSNWATHTHHHRNHTHLKFNLTGTKSQVMSVQSRPEFCLPFLSSCAPQNYRQVKWVIALTYPNRLAVFGFSIGLFPIGAVFRCSYFIVYSDAIHGNRTKLLGMLTSLWKPHKGFMVIW